MRAEVEAMGPISEGVPARHLGIAAGRLEISDDFDAPLPDELLAAFEGFSEPEDELWLGQGSAGEEPQDTAAR